MADVRAQHSIEVHIYGSERAATTEMILGYFNNKSDCEVVFYSLSESNASERFLKIVNILVMQGVKVTERCLPCQYPNITLEEARVSYATPLIGFFQGGKLEVITVGVTFYSVLDKALGNVLNSSDLKVFTYYSVNSLSDEGLRARLEELFTGQESSEEKETSFLYLASVITLLASADSVNPCTFAVFTALLLIALRSLGRIKTAATGLSFILAIFIGYYALGLGLFRILTYITFADKIVAVFGLVIGAFSIILSLTSKFKSPVPKSLRRHIDMWINKFYKSAIASFVLGLAASFTLLPCSSGPYVVCLGLLSTLKDSIQVYSLLTLYNVIFVSPLIIILIVILAFGSLVRKIKAFRSSKLGVMEFVMGVILVLVCLYLLLS